METESAYYINLITRYFYGESTPEEIRELELWVKSDPANTILFTDFQKTWKAMEDQRIKTSIDHDHEWTVLSSRLSLDDDDIQPRTDPRKETQSEFVTQKPFILSFALRAAAIFLLLAIPAYFLYRYLQNPSDLLVTADTGIVEKKLPDGTMVFLRVGSTLTYPADFGDHLRRVVLEGEAWFEVAHDPARPFIVTTGDIGIRVMGTTFLVNTQTLANTREIILSAGIVNVYLTGRPETSTLLFPGEKAEISAGDDAFVKSVNADRNYLSWKTRHMEFENTPLNEVVALLTKVYQTNIRLAGIGLNDCRITTTFDNQTLESVLDVLKATLDLQVTKTRTGIELSGSGCGSRK